MWSLNSSLTFRVGVSGLPTSWSNLDTPLSPPPQHTPFPPPPKQMKERPHKHATHLELRCFSSHTHWPSLAARNEQRGWGGRTKNKGKGLPHHWHALASLDEAGLGQYLFFYARGLLGTFTSHFSTADPWPWGCVAGLKTPTKHKPAICTKRTHVRMPRSSLDVPPGHTSLPFAPSSFFLLPTPPRKEEEDGGVDAPTELGTRTNQQDQLLNTIW